MKKAIYVLILPLIVVSGLVDLTVNKNVNTVNKM